MPLALYVAAGSAAGGVLRYLLALAVQPRAGTTFPVATLLINVAGSLLLGVLVRALAAPGTSAEARLLLTTGLCGGFTTFSTFSAETVALLQMGDWRRAAWYVALSVALSVGACALGVRLGAGLAARGA